ncbi:hypothetical protein FACS1894184_07570 [Clostridia bacterium]|nr:hypothetical protein FACS1894184_07570 [Clostridia bacterium]
MPVSEDAARLRSVAGLLGLAHKAGQTASGEDGALALIRKGGAALALMDESTGPNTSKRLTDACQYYKVSLSRLPKDMLGDAIGKPGRVVAAVRKGSLADSLSAALKGSAFVVEANQA